MANIEYFWTALCQAIDVVPLELEQYFLAQGWQIFTHEYPVWHSMDQEQGITWWRAARFVPLPLPSQPMTTPRYSQTHQQPLQPAGTGENDVHHNGVVAPQPESAYSLNGEELQDQRTHDDEDNETMEDSDDEVTAGNKAQMPWLSMLEDKADSDLLYRHRGMEVTIGNETRSVWNWLQDDVEWPTVQAVINRVRDVVKNGQYERNVKDDMRLLPTILKAAEACRKENFEHIANAYMAALEVIGYASILRTACQYVPAEFIQAKYNLSQTIKDLDEYCPPELDGIVEQAFYDIRTMGFSFPQCTDSDRKAEADDVVLSLKLDLWTYLLDPTSRAEDAKQHLTTAVQNTFISPSLSNAAKVVCLALGSTAFPMHPFDVRGSHILAGLLTQLKQQWRRDHVFGTIAMVPGISADFHVFADANAARAEYLSSRSQLDLLEDDDLDTLRGRRDEFIRDLVIAMAQMPPNGLDLTENGRRNDMARELLEELQKLGSEEAVKRRLSAVAVLIFEFIQKLHSTGGSHIEEGATAKKLDLRLTATKRAEYILKVMADAKGLVVRCLKREDGIAEVVTFPHTYWRRLYDNARGNKSRAVKARKLKAVANAVAEEDSAGEDE